MTPYGMFTMNVRFITCVNGPRRTRKNPRGTQMLDAGVLLCPRARFWRPVSPSKRLPRKTPLSPRCPLHISSAIMAASH